jgi:protease I
MKSISDKKIVMVIAPRLFRDEEFKIPYELFCSCGAKVSIASTSLSEAMGKLGLKINPEILVSDIDESEFDAIVFVGGPGIKELWDNKELHKLTIKFFDSGKITAAICSAPVIFSRAGIINGKKVTSFPGDEAEMLKGNSIYTSTTVQKDGNIITGNGPAASQEFAELVLNSL